MLARCVRRGIGRAFADPARRRRGRHRQDDARRALPLAAAGRPGPARERRRIRVARALRDRRPAAPLRRPRQRCAASRGATSRSASSCWSWSARTRRMRHASSSSTTPTSSTPSRCERCCSPPAGCSPAARSSCSSCAGAAEDTLPEGWRKLAAGSTGGTLTVGPLGPSHISDLGLALGVAMTPDAASRLWEHTRGSPLYARAVLRELPADDSWQYEPRPLPVPESYAHLVRRDLERCRDRRRHADRGGRRAGRPFAAAEGRRAGRSRGTRSRRWMRRSRAGSCGWTTAPAARPSSSRTPWREARSTKLCRRRGAPRSTAPPRASSTTRSRRCAIAWKPPRSPTTRCSRTSRRTHTRRCHAAHGRAPCRA